MQTPKVVLTEKGVEREYPLILKNIELDALESETGIGIPVGVIEAVKQGKLGVSYFASVITLGISRTKRTTRAKVLEAMTRPIDEYMLPCLKAVFIAAGRPEIAEAFDGALEDEEIEETLEEAEAKGATSLVEGEGDDPLNPTQEKAI